MSDTSYLEDFPNGPLDKYRKLATFDWKKMKFVFEDPDLYKIKLNMWKTFERDPLFQRPNENPTTEEMKRITAKRLHRYLQYTFVPTDISVLAYKRKTRYMMTLNEALHASFPDVSIKHAVGCALFCNAVGSLGTERHKFILEQAWNKKIVACFALTEVAHGSNTKRMLTTATYDKNTQEFIINTPDFKGAKCWVGNLGKQATLALVFAQLITNGQNHGLHAFLVPIRDPKTLLPYSGIIVGDIGEKIGLHGIDNGFIMFKNYRVPRENLLNRCADVTPEGEYESSFSEPGKILGAALENLSTARVGILQECVNNLINAVTIAVRYAAVRTQFSENGEDKEYEIIEYPLHQFRLFPYVAAAAVLKIYVHGLSEDYLSAVELSTKSDRLEDINNLVAEIHSLISSSKPSITWITRDAIQECREACGGHGFLSAARIGDLRNTTDPCVTFEGDNNVLGQQASNWLLRQWGNVLQGNRVASPVQSCAFFERHEKISARKFVPQNVQSLEFIMNCYEWLVLYLVKETDLKQKECERNGDTRFMARNKSQVYRALILTRTYLELNALRYFIKKLNTLEHELQSVLLKFGILYGLVNLDKHLVYFYEGGFTSSPQMAKLIRNGIQELCANCKDNVIAFIDALAPPDYIVNSILGRADGKLYENLETEFFHNKNAMARPEWWNEIIIEGAPDLKNLKLQSKL